MQLTPSAAVAVAFHHLSWVESTTIVLVIRLFSLTIRIPVQRLHQQGHKFQLTGHAHLMLQLLLKLQRQLNTTLKQSHKRHRKQLQKRQQQQHQHYYHLRLVRQVAWQHLLSHLMTTQVTTIKNRI